MHLNHYKTKYQYQICTLISNYISYIILIFKLYYYQFQIYRDIFLHIPCIMQLKMMKTYNFFPGYYFHITKKMQQKLLIFVFFVLFCLAASCLLLLIYRKRYICIITHKSLLLTGSINVSQTIFKTKIRKPMHFM